MSKRKAGHITKSKVDTKRKVYEHLNKIGWDTVSIILIENCECKNKEELHRMERYYIETLKATLNIQVPTRKLKEYNKDNKDKLHMFKKIYRESHKDQLNLRQKEWRDTHKEEIKRKKSEWYLANKEVINAKRKLKREHLKDQKEKEEKKD